MYVGNKRLLEYHKWENLVGLNIGKWANPQLEGKILMNELHICIGTTDYRKK